MRTNKCLSLAATGLLLAVQVQATTWNAADDFSTTAGQNVLVNGVWSYGTYDHVAGLYANIPSSRYDPNGWGNPGLNTWYTDNMAAGWLPGCSKNNSSGPILGLPVGEMAMLPANPSFAVDHPVLLWTCPATGYYQFNLGWNYYGGAGGGSGVVTSMTRDLAGSTAIGGAVAIGTWGLTAGAPTATLVQTFSLSAGETMAFAVNPGFDNDSDTTGIALTVATVPTGFWDASTDFSLAANPNGVWSYEWVNSSSGASGLMTLSETDFGGQPGLNAWDLGASSLPCVVKNASYVSTYYGWVPGKLGLHPATSSDRPVIRWTAPSNGVYQVSASATHVGNWSSDGVDVSVCRNLAGSLAGSLWTTNLAVGAAAYYDGVYSLTNGESVALVLGNGGAGNNVSDSTTVDFTVTPLPLATNVLWDARADFSATINANANGVWSYEWANSSSGTAGLLTNMDPDGFSNTGLNTWYVPGSPGLPNVTKNNGSGATYYGLLPGRLGVSPYVSSATWNEAVIRWTAPFNGEFQFAAIWKRVGDWGGTSHGDRVNASVQANFTGSLVGSLWTGYSDYGVPVRWNGTRKLKAGESMAFVTGNGGTDNYGWDTTQTDIFVALLSRPKGTLITVK